MKPSTVLKRALKKIEKSWSRTSEAVNSKTGDDVEPWAKSADKWCAVGAVKAVLKTHDTNGPLAFTILADAVPDRSELTNYWKIAVYNDDDAHNKRDVVRLFNRAIKLAKKEGK